MPFTTKAQITGLQDVFKRLRRVDDKVRKKILRSALTAGGQIVLLDARSKVPVNSGLLKESLCKKVKAYQRSGTVVVIVGPRTGFKRTVQHAYITSANLGERSVVENPTAIAHLAGP